MTHKNRKKKNFMFRSAGCSLLRAEDFSCSLGVLYGGLGNKSFARLYIKKNFAAVNFFKILAIKTLNLDPDPHPH